MLKELRNGLRSCMSLALYTERARRGLSQEKMAELLHISRRFYADLEAGKSLCGLGIFLLFLNLLEDPTSFVMDLLAVCKQALKKYNNPD